MAQPVITSLSLSAGPVGGGTPVVITGTNFTGATKVEFGTGFAAVFTVDSDTQISATTPAVLELLAWEVVHVVVTTPGGVSASTDAAQFRYLLTDNTLLVNGVDLASIVSCVQSLDGMFSVSEPRGDDITFPGVDGETWTDKPYGSGTIDVGLIMSGSTTAEFNDQLRALKTLIQPGKLLTLVRHLSYSTGLEAHTTQATYQSGLSPTVQFMRFGKATVSLKILDGVWYDTSTRNVSVAEGGSVTGVGETRTHKMTITMAPNSILRNNVNNFTVSTVGLTDTSTPVVIDVMNHSATQGGPNVSAFLTWNSRFPMRIQPGVQTFSYSGAGSASITYTPAYT